MDPASGSELTEIGTRGPSECVGGGRPKQTKPRSTPPGPRAVLHDTCACHIPYSTNLYIPPNPRGCLRVGVPLDRVHDLVNPIEVLDEAHVVDARLALVPHLPAEQEQGAIGDVVARVGVYG